MNIVSRRRLLNAMLFGGLVPTLRVERSDDPDPLVAALLELVTEEARDLGRRYLHAYPDTPADRVALGAELVAAAARQHWITARIDDRRRWFAERVAADFGAGRIVEVDGWVLAESEAKLCALAACPPTAA
jgi:hypothetical protein